MSRFATSQLSASRARTRRRWAWGNQSRAPVASSFQASSVGPQAVSVLVLLVAQVADVLSEGRRVPLDGLGADRLVGGGGPLVVVDQRELRVDDDVAVAGEVDDDIGAKA